MGAEAGRSGAGDFDFFIGSWGVAHRRLKERLAGCNDWLEFGGTCVTQKILGGLGNMDDNFLDLPGDAYRAVTLRSFDPAKKLWSIWWLDGRNPGSQGSRYGFAFSGRCPAKKRRDGSRHFLRTRGKPGKRTGS